MGQPPASRLALLGPELGIKSISFQQIFVCSLLSHTPIFQYDNLVRAHDGLEPVGNDDDRLFRHQSRDGLLDQNFVFRVKGCGGLIQQNDGSILMYGLLPTLLMPF